ncbi:MAG: YihY/virulence factor BrkB family protein [Pirellulaceae bacterium]
MSSSDSPTHGWQSIKQVPPLRLLIATAKEWYEDKALELGAALAYYTVFAVSPIVLLTIAIASKFLGRDAAEGRIKQQIETTVGPTVAEAIQSMLAYNYRSGAGLLASIIGVVVLLVAAMGFFGQLQSALNTIWDVRPKPGAGWWRTVQDRFLSFLAVLGACLLLLAGLLASAAMSALANILPSVEMAATLHLWQALTLGVLFVLLTLAFGLVYQYLPDVKIAWRDVWIGAAVTAALAILGNYLISLYLRWSGTTSAYGAAGSIVVILMWGYYSAQILLFGAEFTQVYARRLGNPIEPSENAERVTPNDPS